MIKELMKTGLRKPTGEGIESERHTYKKYVVMHQVCDGESIVG